MRALTIVAATAVLGLSSAFLVACGDRSHLIPQADAQSLNDDLDQISSDLSATECRRAGSDVEQALKRVDDLPAQVDQALRENLRAGLTQVAQRVAMECGRKTKTTATTPTQPTETTPPPTTETTPPTPTTTQEPTTTTPPPTPTSPAPGPSGSGGTPPSGGGDGGRGAGSDGGGNGNGNGGTG